VGPLVDLVAIALAIPLLVFVHELGHAAVAVLLGHPVRELRVGDNDAGLAVRWRAFTLRLGPITGERDFAGFVAYDGTRAGAWHFLLIALAGPVASLAAGLAAGYAAIAFQSHRFALLVMLVGGLQMGVGNLSARASDGRRVRTAWRVLRASRHPSTRS
jgi:membrane-associated protease RseP (regulator of RpoE activity)